MNFQQKKKKRKKVEALHPSKLVCMQMIIPVAVLEPEGLLHSENQMSP